jgi:hypothetical protein
MITEWLTPCLCDSSSDLVFFLKEFLVYYLNVTFQGDGKLKLSGVKCKPVGKALLRLQRFMS